VHINANGVDLQRFQFTPDGHQGKTLVFTGNMSYFPNVNAVTWFANEVFPLIKAAVPDVRFFVVGTNPHPTIQALAQRDPAITVTGHVQNMQDYLATATIAVVPMRAGSGMQFKVIEAMACGTPVIVTPYALGGIDVAHEQHLLVAATANEFATQVTRLLQDADLRLRLAHAARQLVVDNYTWERVVSDLEMVYQQAARRS
jgi:glycosyltransferase involved in cell wall biosynthesis